MKIDPPNKLRYYALNDFTRELVPLANYAEQVDYIKRNMSAGEFSDNDRDRYAWASKDFTVMELIDWIYADNGPALVRFANAAQQYAQFFNGCSYVQQARLYAVMACDRLSKLGYDRSKVNLGMIKAEAEKLWRDNLARRSDASSTSVKLPEVKWREIYRDIGIDDLPPQRRGRPPRQRQLQEHINRISAPDSPWESP